MTDNLEQRLRSSLHATPLPAAPDVLYARLGELAASVAQPRRLPRRNLPRPIFLMGAVLLLAAAIAATAIGSRPSPQIENVTAPTAALDAYLQALVAGDCATASQHVNLALIGQWNAALCGSATHVTAYTILETSPFRPLPNKVFIDTVLMTTGSAAGLPPGNVDVSFALQQQSSGAWLVVDVYPAGPILPSPAPTPMNPWTAPASWPWGVKPDGFEATLRAACGPMLSAPDFASLPLVLDSYIPEDGSTFSGAIFGNDNTTAACIVQSGPGGAQGGTGGGGESGPAWLHDHGLQPAGHAGLALAFGSPATHPLDWNTAVGVAPSGVTTIRMVVGDRVSDAVVAHGMYIVAWQGLAAPTALIAWDAQGNEIDRIAQPALAQVFPETSSSTPFVWSREVTDPAPGPTVVGQIANALGVASMDVTAAVFGFEQPVGNKAWIWVFRASGVSSQAAIGRWVEAETKCSSVPGYTTLAGLPTTLTTHRLVDQCQPEYLVALDSQTVALIVDDGGYQGNAAAATPVPYRPAAEIGQLVTWLQANLPRTPHITGAPNLHNR